MKIFYPIWCLTLLYSFAETLARAENANFSPITLEEVRALALDKSPLVKALDGEYATRLAEALDVKLFPNPELNVTAGIPSHWKEKKGNVEFDATLGQPLKLSYFGERQTVSSLIEKAALGEQKLSLFKLLKEVDLSYARLWAFQEQKRILEDARTIATSRLKKIQEGRASGLFSMAEEKLFNAEANKLDAELQGISGDIQAAQAALTRVIGSSLASRRLSKLILPERLNPEQVIQAEKDNSIGATGRADLLTELSINQARLAHRDAFPEFSPQLLFSHSNEGVTFVGAGISIPLPLSNRNQPQILQREGELRSAKANRDYVSGEGFRSELMSLVDAANLALGQARTYETKVIPAFHEALNFQVQQFEAGVGSVLQTWQIQRELYETRVKGLELWTKAFATQIELEVLIGQEIR